MNPQVEQALQRFLVEANGSAALGASDPNGQLTPAEREAAAFEKLMAQRHALVQGERWRSMLPITVIVILAIVGVASAVRSNAAGAIAVAVAAGTAAMFRLLAAAESEKSRAMVFTLLQLAQRDGKFPPADLVALLVKASQPGRTSPDSDGAFTARSAPSGSKTPPLPGNASNPE